MLKTQSNCPICLQAREFEAADDFWACRDGLHSAQCPLGNCVVRERAVAEALFSLYHRSVIINLSIHEAAPTPRGISLWLLRNVKRFIKTGYFPGQPPGSTINGLRNEDLEKQTFQDESFDIVLHLDVLEHLFDPFRALNEIYRTLKPGGRCLFTAPTEYNRLKSEQVAWIEEDGKIIIVGKPEYHGNPQKHEEGSLVTWRYGYDLPALIGRHTDFDVEVRRWQNKTLAIMGYMNEVYILTKQN